MKTVAVLVGSLRRESLNRKFAESLAKLASGRLTFRFVEIGDLPLYNEDLWASPPEAVLRLKRDIEAADAVLFVTPEYNRSFSPALKNAIDWASRPWGQNSWAGKPAAIIGTSPGATGGSAGQNALKGLLSVVDTILMGQPEVYFTYRPDLFDAQNNIVDLSTKAFLSGWIDRFAAWIARMAPSRISTQDEAA
ncbi:NADPH-dependent FMN reductase [Microvirga massiliensis]|uniref:NADPH-dependent FMN reductase n=1 Tax=Microvirga massiliensis TaxID=1033741 RepID=UPI000A4C9D20|nr:NAD(P)H-dependent oxidoreductase [Microvirga massiliensis]